jgi:adenine-specific DNA-methyltransferase
MARRRLVDAARLLRRDGVRSERMLWEALRDRRLDGVRFKRQQPIDRYIVDFFAPAARLVVEVDGSFHDGREDMDETRQAELERCGLHFVRLRSEDVERDLASALERIRSALPLYRASRERPHDLRSSPGMKLGSSSEERARAASDRI